LGQPTLGQVGMASLGVALPFFFYILAMFALVIPMWLQNFQNDSAESKGGSETVLTVDGSESMGTDDGISILVGGHPMGFRYT
jgi:hypothetical protein